MTPNPHPQATPPPPVTPEQLAEWARLCEAATPGPWAWERSKFPAYNRNELVAPCATPTCPHGLLEFGDMRDSETEDLFMADCADAKRTVLLAEHDLRLQEQDAGDRRPSPIDAAFIAAARTALPACLAEIARLRAELALYHDRRQGRVPDESRDI